MSGLPLIILRRKEPHRLPEGWIECPTCKRQLKLTNAGLVPGHYRRGESHHMGVDSCPTRGVKP
jgi:hypothetical protein